MYAFLQVLLGSKQVTHKLLRLLFIEDVNVPLISRERGQRG